MKTNQLLTASGAVATGATAFAFGAYLCEISAAKRRIEAGRQRIDSIEFADSGEGPAILIIHGAGGGFDQGLDLGRTYCDSHHRIIAPSRFGYLGTPLPADASAEAQADAYVRLLDALHLDRVPVIGVSAGGPSAMQFALRHPDRCAALLLIVPMAYLPERTALHTLPRWAGAVLKSDFLFWTAMKTAHLALVETILGVPRSVYRGATDEERVKVDALMCSILPISRRAAGLTNDAVVASTLTRYAVEDIHVPTLVISAEDCLYGTFESSRYTANNIPEAKFVGFPTGGHLLVGHEEEVRTEVLSFLTRVAAATPVRSEGEQRIAS